jgi:hypothetical protein
MPDDSRERPNDPAEQGFAGTKDLPPTVQRDDTIRKDQRRDDDGDELVGSTR